MRSSERQPRRLKRRSASNGANWSLIGAFIAAIVALVSIIVGMPPSLQSYVPIGRTPTPVLDARSLIDASIRRFERPPLRAGILHERYLSKKSGAEEISIERWYDYAWPHRLRIIVRSTEMAGAPLLEIATDGRTQVQYRIASSVGTNDTAIDAQLDTARIQALVPLLRQAPAATFAFWRSGWLLADAGPGYLGPARTANPVLYGHTTELGRPAFLVSYQNQHPTSNSLARFLLTIDAETYTLLRVAIVNTDTTSSVTQNPITVQEISVVAGVSDDLFTLPTVKQVIRRSDLSSARVPLMPISASLTLEDAWSRVPELLIPHRLPDRGMRGIILAGGGEGIGLIFESEYRRLMVWPRMSAMGAATPDRYEGVGPIRFRFIDQGERTSSTAEVYQTAAPELRTQLILVDEYATAQEREEALRAVIASLTQVTAQNLADLQRYFDRNTTSGGTN